MHHIDLAISVLFYFTSLVFYIIFLVNNTLLLP